MGDKDGGQNGGPRALVIILITFLSFSFNNMERLLVSVEESSSLYVSSYGS